MGMDNRVDYRCKHLSTMDVNDLELSQGALSEGCAAALSDGMNVFNSPWRIVSRFTAASVFLVVALPAAGAPPSRPLVPLPDGVTRSDKQPVRGFYADLGFSLTTVNVDLRSFEEECRNRGIPPRVEGRELVDKGMRRLYRTVTAVAVFEDNPWLDLDAATCTARVSLKRTVHAQKGPWKTTRTSDWTYPTPRCERFQRCEDTVVEGVPAKCINTGDGFVGSVLCYSRKLGLSEGLLLSFANYTDDGSGPDNGWTLTNITFDADIDPVVFEIDVDRR